MKLDELKRAYPPLSEAGQARFLRTLEGLQENAPQKPRFSYALAFAILAILLLAASAVALIHQYSVRQVIHPKFAQEVLLIGEEHESGLMRVRINDAFMDGQRLTLALSMEAQPGVTDLYVFPCLTAESGGKPLDLDIESGYDLFDGEWLPRRKEAYGEPGQFIVDMFIMEDQFPEERGDITWTLTFHVLKPNWPLQQEQSTLKGEFSSGTADMEAFARQFKEAYQNKIILLNDGDQTFAYDSYLPRPEGVTEEEYLYMRDWERLVRSGAFSEVERFTKTFDTKSVQLPVYVVEGADKKSIPAFDFRLAELTATSQYLTVSFDLNFKDRDYLKKGDSMGITLYVEDKPVNLSLTSSNFTYPKDGPEGYTGRLQVLFNLSQLKEQPGTLRLTPRREMQEVMEDKTVKTVIQEEPGAAITLRLKQ